MALPLAVGIDGSETGLEVDLATADAARHRLSLHLVHAAAGDREPSDVISAASERAGGRNPRVQLSSEVLYEGAAAALVDTKVRRCRLTAVHTWNPPPRALTPRPTPSSYALEARRRPPCQVLDDALRGRTRRHRDARASPKVCECPARRQDLLVVGACRRQGHPGLCSWG